MSENILQEIAEYAHERVAKDKEEVSEKIIKLECGRLTRTKIDDVLAGEVEPFQGRFHAAIAKSGLSVISELKKASPSKGVISKDFSYLSRAVGYEVAGADAVSCVTEPKWFLGESDMVVRVKKEIDIPILKKDFFVDEYQIYQARNQGADAILLICSLLDDETLKYFIKVCNTVKLDALVETHDEDEIKRAVQAGAQIIGVNNRDLKDFSVDTKKASDIGKVIPEGILFVSESGIKDENDARAALDAGADAILVGEALMVSDDYMDLIRRMKTC